MESKCIENHDNSQNENGVHSTIFEIFIFLDAFNVAHGKFPQDKGAESVSDEDKRNRKGEGECSNYAVDGECCVENLEIGNLANIGHASADEFFLLFFGKLSESVNDEKHGGAHHCRKPKHWINLERVPDDEGEQ